MKDVKIKEMEGRELFIISVQFLLLRLMMKNING